MMHYAGTKTKNDHSFFEDHSRHADRGDDMSLAGMTVVITLAGLIGLWGLTCLLSGLVKGGGILGLGAAWISAVFGF